MTDVRDADDAPLAASKHPREAAHAAADITRDSRGETMVGRAVTISKPAAELYRYFRNFAKLPSFMENVERIDVLDARRSHWVVKSPGGGTVEWDATVTEEEEGRLIAWTSDEGADVPNSGRITFQEAGARGTVVTATILYDPPAGIIGKVIAKMFQREPAIQARRDLNRFKQLMETGEVATSVMNHKQLEEKGR